MKTVKKLLLSLVSILGISTVVWIVLLMNPTLSYANQTQIDNIKIYHNEALEDGAEQIIKNAINIIKNAEIYDEEIKIQLCINDDKLYPKLHPFAGGTAYAFLNKTVIYGSEPDFKNNHATFRWEINNYELRKYNLTTLLAHEFMHNLQHNHSPKYQMTSTLGKINWKLEGHAEYIAREFKNDGRLKEKIAKYLKEETKSHVGVPVFTTEDGTIQNLSYFKYTIVIQYLMEIKALDFNQICDLDPAIDSAYSAMIQWYKITRHNEN